MKPTIWRQWWLVGLLVTALLLAGCCPVGNSAPQITSLSADPATVDPGADTAITCVATDADGDTLTYSWSYSGPAVGSIAGTGGTVDWTVPDAEGTYTVSVTVSDGKGGTDEGTCTVIVEVSVTTGSIDVKSDPAGAHVYLDGADTGNITPYVLTDVEEDDHTLRLSKENFKDRQGTVSVAAGETTYVNWELDAAPPQTVTIQPDGTQGKDAHVYSADPGANEGDLEVLAVGNNGGEKIRAYIRFELAGIPAAAVVTSADLLLWYGDSSDAVETTIEAYQVTAAWAENTITWDSQPGHGTAARGSSVLPDVETSDFVAWELEPGLIEGWVDGSSANHGLMLIDADEDTPGAWKVFASSDHPTANMRPKLVITYYDPSP